MQLTSLPQPDTGQALLVGYYVKNRRHVDRDPCGFFRTLTDTFLTPAASLVGPLELTFL